MASIVGACTSEAVDCPLLELLEGDVCRGRRRVEVEPVGILLLLVTAVDELLFAVVDVPPFWVYPVEILSEHVDCGAEGRSGLHDQSILVNSKAVRRGVESAGGTLGWETRLDALCPKDSH